MEIGLGVSQPHPSHGYPGLRHWNGFDLRNYLEEYSLDSQAIYQGAQSLASAFSAGIVKLPDVYTLGFCRVGNTLMSGLRA